MLTIVEKMFVKEYLKDLNATQAFIRATREEKNAKQRANQWLKKPEINEAIAKEMERYLSVLDIDNNYVLSNIKEVLETSMARSPITTSEDGTPITSYDPTTALKATEQLGKYLKLFTDKMESINVQTDFEEYIKKVESEDEY